jgi:ketosteroid isomerase-like protein
MEESTEVRDAWIGFCERLTAGDVEGFDDLVAPDAVLIIGTAPGEWVDDRQRMRFGFETEGVGLSPDAPIAFAEGSMGWVADNPRFGFPDGSAIKPRVTSVWRRDGEAWKLVHAHFSVGVPDDEVVELQQRWAS